MGTICGDEAWNLCGLLEKPTDYQSLAVRCHHGRRQHSSILRKLWPIGRYSPALTPISRSRRYRRKRTILPQDRAPSFRLAIWFFWLLASLAVGAIIGASLSVDDSIFVGTIVGGLIFTGLHLWLKGFD
jgi:hypothetical protein